MDDTSKKSAPTRYALPMLGLHWLMVILIAAAYATIELREYYPKGSDPRAALKALHYLIGLSVFALVWLRVLVRTAYPKPELHPSPPRWQEASATAMHYALYALMIALPLLGWLTVSAEGKPVDLMGFQLPALIAQDKTMAKTLKEVHEILGKIGYLMIGLHASMALIHHFWMRDNTLLRMWPGRDSLSSSTTLTNSTSR